MIGYAITPIQAILSHTDVHHDMPLSDHAISRIYAIP